VASDNSESAYQAIDGDGETRWGTGRPQSEGMRFAVQFSSRNIRGVRYELGRWHHDYPRALTVEVVPENGGVKVLCEVKDFHAIRHFLNKSSSIMFFFEEVKASKVVLTQRGAHPILDWSVAELEVFG